MDTRCKNCGAPLMFDTNTYNVFCKACGSSFFDLDKKSKLKATEKECVFCGGQFQENNPSIITLKCPYCSQKTIKDYRVYEYKGFVILPFKYYYDQAKAILLKKIPITRNKKYIKQMLEDASESMYVPFHAYNLEIEGVFTWQCSKTEEEEDGVDSEGNKKYKSVTKYWTETRTAVYDFKNTPVVSTTLKQEPFELTKRTYKKLTFQNEDLEYLEPKYFLMSKYSYRSDRPDKDTFSDFIDYAYEKLKDMSTPSDADYVISYYLNYNYLLVTKDRYEVLIPFYFYQDERDQDYYCYVNAYNGEVKYKCPVNLVFVFIMILLGTFLLAGIIFLIVYLCTR